MGLTRGPAAGFEHEIDGTATVDIYKVDTACIFLAQDFCGRYHRRGFVASELDTKDAFGGVSTDQRPLLARRGEERGSEAH